MNVTHKCHFHPNNNIHKFCTHNKCTLPLCSDCEPIHYQEHQDQLTQPQLMRFNQAYLHAANELQDYLTIQRKELKQYVENVQKDRKEVMNMLEQYFGEKQKWVQQLEKDGQQIEAKLNKLKKGSIKTLIYFYSGDIQLNNYNINFLPIAQNIRNMLKPIAADHQKQNYQYKTVTPHQEPLIQNPQPSDPVALFSTIQQIQNKYKDKGRRSIFESAPKHLPNYQLTTLPNHKEQHQYAYKQYEVMNQQQNQTATDTTPKFDKNNPGQNYRDTVNLKDTGIVSIKQGDTDQCRSSVRLNNRFPNEYEGSAQYQNYLKDRQSMIKKDQMLNIMDNHQTKKQPAYIYNVRPLKAEDLQTNQLEVKHQLKQHQLTSRNRVMSQTNILNKQNKKNGDQCDLKRQILPPEEIRKMLEKRIEERNRILSIKKGQNNQPGQEKAVSRKIWDTKDSIINQIYGQTKY